MGEDRSAESTFIRDSPLTGGGISKDGTAGSRGYQSEIGRR